MSPMEINREVVSKMKSRPEFQPIMTVNEERSGNFNRRKPRPYAQL
jgi:hypothetical protein